MKPLSRDRGTRTKHLSCHPSKATVKPIQSAPQRPLSTGPAHTARCLRCHMSGYQTESEVLGCTGLQVNPCHPWKTMMYSHRQMRKTAGTSVVHHEPFGLGSHACCTYQPVAPTAAVDYIDRRVGTYATGLAFPQYPVQLCNFSRG